MNILQIHLNKKLKARILLIHLTSEFDSKSGIKLTKELEKFFSLACNLEKNTRIRYFGIVTFGSAYRVKITTRHLKKLKTETIINRRFLCLSR